MIIMIIMIITINDHHNDHDLHNVHSYVFELCKVTIDLGNYVCSSNNPITILLI